MTQSLVPCMYTRDQNANAHASISKTNSLVIKQINSIILYTYNMQWNSSTSVQDYAACNLHLMACVLLISKQVSCTTNCHHDDRWNIDRLLMPTFLFGRYKVDIIIAPRFDSKQFFCSWFSGLYRSNYVIWWLQTFFVCMYSS